MCCSISEISIARQRIQMAQKRFPARSGGSAIYIEKSATAVFINAQTFIYVAAQYLPAQCRTFQYIHDTQTSTR